MGRTQGPVSVRMRVRSAAGGPGKVEWLGEAGAEKAAPKSVAFEVPAGEWRELAVEVPAQGLLGTTRLYLPASPQPLELDWVEIRSGKTPPQRWNFDTP